MLTKRQNLLETIHGGNPDRYVKQFEAFSPLVPCDPHMDLSVKPGCTFVDPWGVTNTWPEGAPGIMPVHDEAHIVVKDIENWKDYVKAPTVDDGNWEFIENMAAGVDRNEQFLTAFIAPGVFERCHHLCEIANACIYLYENPDEMHELIQYITDWELRLAEAFIGRIHPDAVFHHDDWGSQISTLMSADMFEEFFVPAYKQIYGYYKDNGVELIIHHSDSYCETFVPYMIDMGIDIWQGALDTNDIPGIIKKYDGKISIMGGINSGKVDKPGWTKEEVKDETERVIDWVGSKNYFIPNATQGGDYSTFPGVYEEVDAAIDAMSAKDFA